MVTLIGLAVLAGIGLLTLWSLALYQLITRRLPLLRLGLSAVFVALVTVGPVLGLLYAEHRRDVAVEQALSLYAAQYRDRDAQLVGMVRLGGGWAYQFLNGGDAYLGIYLEDMGWLEVPLEEEPPAD